MENFQIPLLGTPGRQFDSTTDGEITTNKPPSFQNLNCCAKTKIGALGASGVSSLIAGGVLGACLGWLNPLTIMMLIGSTGSFGASYCMYRHEISKAALGVASPEKIDLPVNSKEDRRAYYIYVDYSNSESMDESRSQKSDELP